MNLWTVITKDELNTLERESRLVCDDKNKNCMANEYYKFEMAYDFMASKLEEKTKPKFSIKYPRWAWYAIDGVNSKQKGQGWIDTIPNYSIGKNNVLLELIKNDNEVLLSDADIWTIVLNGAYISDSQKEDDDFSDAIKKCGLKELDIFNPQYIETLTPQEKGMAKMFQQEIVNSWDKVFDLNDNNPYCRYKEKNIQAVFWEINYDKVISIYEK